MQDIKAHQYFRAVDWEGLELRQVQAPYKPPVQDPRDLTHFDPQFTQEAARLTPDDEGAVAKIDQSEFEGWEYVNPLLLGAEDAL